MFISHRHQRLDYIRGMEKNISFVKFIYQHRHLYEIEDINIFFTLDIRIIEKRLLFYKKRTKFHLNQYQNETENSVFNKSVLQIK